MSFIDPYIGVPKWYYLNDQGVMRVTLTEENPMGFYEITEEEFLRRMAVNQDNFRQQMAELAALPSADDDEAPSTFESVRPIGRLRR